MGNKQFESLVLANLREIKRNIVKMQREIKNIDKRLEAIESLPKSSQAASNTKIINHKK